MARFSGAALCCLAVQSMPVAAQTVAEGEPDIVVVAATKDHRLTSKELRAAIEAFRKHRARYAPNSRLWFSVQPRGSATLAGVELALVSGTARHPLPIGADGRILIPDVTGDDWRLVSTRPTVPLRLRPWVISPGTTASDIRLGDLQLQCRVGWAIEKQSAPFVVTGMVDAIGPCTSSRFSMYQDFGKPIAAASIEEGARRAPLTLSTWQASQLRLPTYLTGYTAEARVRIEYR